MKEKMV